MPYRNWSISGSSPPRRTCREGRGLVHAGLGALQPEDALDDRAGDQEEQDRRLEDADELGRDAGLDLHGRRAGPHGTEQQRREDDADRARASEQRDRDRVEADGRAVRDVIGCVAPSRSVAPAMPASIPDTVIVQMISVRRHARVARGVRAGAGDPDLEAAGRPEQQEAVEHRHERREDDPEVAVRPRMTGSAALPTWSVVGDAEPGTFSGPLTAAARIAMATKLSMIVVTTSWAPRDAFRKPGMKPHTAPPASRPAARPGPR